jgi:broad specificity phosphatase PhoE
VRSRAGGAIGSEIVLVRHAQSAHVERGWVNADGVRRWMAAYDEAEIALHDPPPPALVELARGAGIVVASDLPRAIASAALLARSTDFQTTALLREALPETAEQRLPRLWGLRLPLRIWGMLFVSRWIWATWRGHPLPGVDVTALGRAEAAADWLTQLASDHRRVVAVTHGTFRTILTTALERRGWKGPERRPFRTWSAWRLTR